MDNIVCYGIDISDAVTMLSYYSSGEKEPQTVSTITGSQVFQIPTAFAKLKGMNHWVYGEQAKQLVKAGQAYGAENMLTKAMEEDIIMVEGQAYLAEELLEMFLTKLFALTGHTLRPDAVGRIVFTIDAVSAKATALFQRVAAAFGIAGDQVMVIDHTESFYYYALSQDSRIYQQDVLLVELSSNTLQSCILKRNTKTNPQTVTLLPENQGTLYENRDEQFAKILQTIFTVNRVSGVFLVGEGFEGDWMKKSLRILCDGRKVFAGMNLYSKGACYAGAVKSGIRKWSFVYIGDNEVKMNLYLQVISERKQQFLTLLSAGDSRYGEGEECEVVLRGNPAFYIYRQDPTQKGSVRIPAVLEGLPQRDKYASRLRITAKPVSDTQADITIKDLGFGELAPATDLSWNFRIGVDSDVNPAVNPTGELYLCRQHMAELPLYMEEPGVNLYSMEELSWYITDQVSLLDKSFMNREIISWISGQMHLEDLARQLQDLYTRNAPVHLFISAIITAGGFLTAQEQRKTLETAVSLENRTMEERHKIRGDHLLEANRCQEAIREYGRILENSSGNTNIRVIGDPWHNMGVAFGRLLFYKEAGECFEKAFQKNHREVSLRCMFASYILADDMDKAEYELQRYHVPEEELSKIEDTIRKLAQSSELEKQRKGILDAKTMSAEAQREEVNKLLEAYRRGSR